MSTAMTDELYGDAKGRGWMKAAYMPPVPAMPTPPPCSCACYNESLFLVVLVVVGSQISIQDDGSSTLPFRQDESDK